MKKVLLLSLLLGMCMWMSCADSNDTSPAAQQKKLTAKLITSPWTTQSVTRSTEDLTDAYQDFSLQLAKGTYTTTHGDLAWSASGTWSFVGESLTQILINDEIEADVNLSKDGKTLTIRFTIDSSVYTDGRAASLEGDYEFVLTNQ